MKRFLFAALVLTACSGSLVDRSGFSAPGSPPARPGAGVCTAPALACGNGACCAPTQIAAGGNTTCAVIGTGVQCWGALLGLGGETSSTPVRVATGLASPSVAVGATHACLIDGGLVKCWGSNSLGELGLPISGPSPGPAAAVPGIVGATQVAVGRRHSCALTASGVFCWGANDSGQLGDPTAAPHAGIFPIVLTAVPSQVTAGDLHTCVKTAAGGVTCWGSDLNGQIGSGVPGAAPVGPTPVALKSGGGGGGGGGGGSTAATAAFLAAGASHTCAIASIGGALPVNELLECWGGNSSGQIGTNTTVDQPTPFELSPVGFSALAAGGAHTCAYSVGATPVPGEDGIATAAGLYCWGNNQSGQLGNGTTGGTQAQPPPAPILTGANGVVALAAGQNHTCALMQDSSLLCWGDNSQGQAGQFGAGPFVTPTQVLSP